MLKQLENLQYTAMSTHMLLISANIFLERFRDLLLFYNSAWHHGTVERRPVFGFCG